MKSNSKSEKGVEAIAYGGPHSTAYSEPWWNSAGYNPVSGLMRGTESDSSSLEQSMDGQSQSDGGMNEEDDDAPEKSQSTVPLHADRSYGQVDQNFQPAASTMPSTLDGGLTQPQQLELVGHSIACAPNPYVDPYYGGMMAAFGQPMAITMVQGKRKIVATRDTNRNESDDSYEPSEPASSDSNAQPLIRKSSTKRARVENPEPSTAPQDKSAPTESESSESSESSEAESPTSNRTKLHLPPSVRFVSDAARRRFLDMNKKNFTLERPLRIAELETYCPSFLLNIQNRGWMRFATTVGEYNPTLVKEFYANNYGDPRQPGSTTVKVRGKVFDYGRKRINEYYGLPQEIPMTQIWEKNQVENKGDARKWVASIIKSPNEPDEPNWATLEMQILTQYLSFIAKAWWGFVNKRILPTRSDGHLSLEQAICVAAIMSDLPLDIGELIERTIRKICGHTVDGKKSKKKTLNLTFPSLLTGLMRQQGITELEHDRPQAEPTPYDILQNKDPRNPKTLARMAQDSMVDPIPPPIHETEGASTPTATMAPDSSTPVGTSAAQHITTSPVPRSQMPRQSARPPPVTQTQILRHLLTRMGELEHTLEQGQASASHAGTSTSSPSVPFDVEVFNRTLERLATSMENQERTLTDFVKTEEDRWKEQDKRSKQQDKRLKDIEKQLKKVNEEVADNSLRIADLQHQFDTVLERTSFNLDDLLPSSSKNPHIKPPVVTESDPLIEPDRLAQMSEKDVMQFVTEVSIASHEADRQRIATSTQAPLPEVEGRGKAIAVDSEQAQGDDGSSEDE